MKHFFLLLKCDFLRLFGLNKALHSGKKGGALKFALIIAFAVILGGVAAATSGMYSFLIVSLMPERQGIALGVFTSVYLIFGLVFAISSASGTIFGGRDYDQLAAYPIKTTTVVFAKSAFVYIFLLLVAVVIIVPSGAVCAFFDGNGLLSGLCLTVYVLFLPFFPLGAGLGIGSFFSWFFARIKHKNVFKIIFSALGVGLYLFLVIAGNNAAEPDDTVLTDLIIALSNALYPVFYAAKGGVYGGWGLLAAVGVSALVAGIYFAVVGKCYKKINDAILTKRAGGKFKLKKDEKKKGEAKAEKNSSFKSLFKVNFKGWLSCPTAVINHAVGPLLMLALVIYFAVSGKFGFLTSGGADGEMNFILDYVKGYAVYAPVFFVGVSSYTCCSVSIEGKNLWIVKSMPVRAVDFFKSKVLLGMLLSFPLTAITQIVLSVCIGYSVYEVIAALLFLFVYSLSANMFGLYVNIKHPFFDWNTPAEAVKRGTSVMICTIVGMLIVVPVSAVNFLVTFVSGSYYYAWAVNILLFAADSAVFIRYFRKNGDALLSAL